MCYKRDLMHDLFTTKPLKVCKREINYGFFYFTQIQTYTVYLTKSGAIKQNNQQINH